MDIHEPDWSAIITAFGRPDGELAEKFGCSRATVQRLRKGDIRDPHWSLGQRILMLHEKRRKRPPRRRARKH